MSRKYILRLFAFNCCLIMLSGCADQPAAAAHADTPVKAALILDVRTPEEFHNGHLQGAINIPHHQIAGKISKIAPDKATELILYCRSGRRVKSAMTDLQQLNYRSVKNYGSIEQAQKILKLPIVR